MNPPGNRFAAASTVVLLVVLTACTSTNVGPAPPRNDRLRTQSSPLVSPSPSERKKRAQSGHRKVHRLTACRYEFPIQPSDAAHYGASHHDYPATDIFAPAGSAFVAPTDGKVNWVSRTDRWSGSVDDPATRGGLSVAIIGDDGVRYYGSHLREIARGIKVGKRVRAGQKLGEVGNTGDARGIAPHLHFGISHPTAPSDWEVRRGEISPYQYLNAWRSGDAITPEVTGAGKPTCKPAS
ncbi:MAG TPA: M23 family metallopeptidase [Actinomycetota bacterium]